MSGESELDRVIRQYITVKSPREIGELVGVEPERVIRRAQELKDEIDALSLEEQVTFLLVRLNRIAADAERDAASASFEFKGGLYSAATSAIRESLRQINTILKSNESAVAELNERRLREILRLFDLIVFRGVEEISGRFGLPREELVEIFGGLLEEAAGEVEG